MRTARSCCAQLREQGCRTEVMSGQQAAAEVAALDEVEQVMAAIVGAAGLVPTLSAIRAGKTVLLANKRVAGDLRPSVYGCRAAVRRTIVAG